MSWLNLVWLVSRLDGSDLSLEARWLGFLLGDFDLGLDFCLGTSISAWLGQIMARWLGSRLRGWDLEMVLARDLSSVARWLGSILAHEDKIKKYIPHFFV